MNEIRENLRNKYVNQYGINTANQIRQLEGLKTKRARYLTSLNFLKRCRDHNLIPTCVKISPKWNIRGSAKILNKASEKLLRRVIQQTRYDLFKITQTIEKTSRNIQLVLSTADFSTCMERLNKRETFKYETCKNNQITKYNKLLQKRSNVVNISQHEKNKIGTQPVTTTQTNTAVVNLSSQTLDENTIQVLSKGLNFAVAPSKIPYEEVICAVEDVMAKNNLKSEDMETIRQDVSSVLRRNRAPKPNLSKPQYLALKNLRNRPDITILHADKGNATVVMDTSDYNVKMEQLLSDESTYKTVKKDPTESILNKTKKLLERHSSTLNLDVKYLTPSCAKPPKLYGLPKIHKTNVPLRPIVSQIDTPTYKLAQTLAKVLSQLRGHSSAFVKDSYHFVSEIKDLHLADNETMVSFDVQSLFTCLPVQDCINIISKKLAENQIAKEYTELLEHCLTSGYLLWKDKFYKQVDGVAMGSPVSPVVADIFMEDFEETALVSSPVKPRFYKRYVDDTFTILPSDKVTVFLDHLNSINPKIQFTMELESNNSLAFLDVLVIRNSNNTLSHTVYRKKTHTDRYLNGESHHHPSQLAAVSKSLFQRARGICDQEHIAEEIQHVKKVLHANQLKVPRNHHKNRVKQATVERQPAILPYIKGITDKIGYILKRASIKTYFKPSKKVSQFLPSVKCHIPLQDPGVYKLDCDCGFSYIGQTKRSIKTRIKEHIADVKHNRYNKSAVCEHCRKGSKHYIRFDKPQILAKEQHYRPRMIREAIEIKKHPKNFNREDGWKLSPSWNPVISLIKPSPQSNSSRQRDTISIVCRSDPHQEPK